ncbi:MAG: hypothetical protein ACJ74H_10065 [Thermoanaerobaculia bacterium]
MTLTIQEVLFSAAAMPQQSRRKRVDDRPRAKTTSEPQGSDRLAAGILAAVITVVFVDVVLGTGVFYARDVVLYHFPLKTILRTVVLNGEFPYWNPFITSGQPLAANPAHGVFYPLTWLVMLPGVFGLNWHALIHIYIGTIGTYALLRSLGTTRSAACIGALSFGLGGFMMSSLSLLAFVFSAAWLPVTCLFTRRFLHHHAPRDFAFAAGSLAMQFLVGEPVTVAQTGLLLGLYALFRKSRLRDLGFVAAISVTALLLSSVQTLPGFDHARDSVRAKGFDFKTVSEWSTPPRRLIEVFYPDVYGSARPDADQLYAGGDLYPRRHVPFILSIYSGLLIVTLALAGATARVRGVWLYLTVTALSLILALGSYTPLLQFLYDVGLVRSIRYPEKFLMMGMFATVLFGARVLDEFLRGNTRVRMAAMVLAGAVALIGAIRYTQADFWRGVILLALLAVSAKVLRGAAVALLTVFVLVDLAPRAAELAPRKPAALYTTVPPALRQLAPNRDDYRILHVGNWSQMGSYRRGYRSPGPNLYVMERNALSGYVAAAYGVRTAAEVDYDLTGLRTSDEFTRAAVALQKINPDLLDTIAAMSNVRYVGFYRAPAEAYQEAGGDAERVNPIRFVERPAQPRYYFASAMATARDRQDFVAQLAAGGHDPHTAFIAGTPFQPAMGRVLQAVDSANHARIDVEAAGKAFLVMSVTAHKYWSVTIDGRDASSVITNLGYQGVIVPPGRHVVEMRYRNPLIAIGGAISLATLLALLFATRRSRITPPVARTP